MNRPITEQARRLGRRCGGLFVAFLEWVIKSCIEEGISKVFFLTREGVFFKAVLDELSNIETVGLEYEILHVSRMSTFLPSMKAFDKTDWDRFLNQYKDQSISAFARSMGTPYDETMRMLVSNGLRENVSIEDQIKLFYETMTSGVVKEYFQRCSMAARDDLKQYLSQQGIDDYPGKIALVDIGWRGTIQDNLCYILPQKTIYGFYLGMIPVLNRQPDNAIKKGFINELPFSEALLKSHTQLEMICTSWNGSILSYRKDSTGIVRPIEDDNAQDIYSWNQYAKYFQEGVLERVQENSVKYARTSSKRFGWKNVVSLLRLTLFPNKHLAKAFFMFRYSEKFGLGVDIDQSELQFSIRPFLEALHGNKERKELRAYLNRSMWPQGFMRVHGLSALIPLYNVVLLLTTN